MKPYVPLTALEHDSQAVIAVAADGSIRLCNRAAQRLLRSGIPPGSTKCWSFNSFLTLDGKPFCRSHCPVQEAALSGQAGAHHWVVPTRGRWAGRPVELVSFFLPWERAPRRGVLHLLRPASLASAMDETTLAVEFAGRVSAREAEVLRLLSDGRATSVIAEALGIATNTVRNHLRSIFRKLGVHGRIEALAALRRTLMPTEEPPQVGPTFSRTGKHLPSRRDPNLPFWLLPFATALMDVADTWVL
jgi:DNA-binding CsgD family transcriptional regulator